MALRIYIRRHSPKCLQRIQARVQAGEIKPLTDDGLKEYSHSRCKCGWWMSGTSDSGVTYKQHALKVYSRADAETKRKEANTSITSEDGISLKNLVEEFLADRKAKNNTEETDQIYRRIGYRCVDFTRQQAPRVIAAKDVTESLITRLRQTWLDDGKKTSTVNYHVDILRMIFRYGVNKGKLLKNPVAGVEPILKKRLRGADADDDEGHEGRTLPLDEEGDTNYQTVLAGVEPFLTGKLIVPGRKYARIKETGLLSDKVRFRLLLMLMYETGLRISDAIHFKPSKIVIDDEVASYTTIQIKTGGEVTVFFPLPLADELAKLTPVSKGYVFYDNSMRWRRFISANVCRPLHDLGQAIGVPNLRPHRFRDSFAVNRLNENMTIEQLRLLLGHKREETTRKYYSPWVKSRLQNLRANYLAARRTGEFAKHQTVVEITTKTKRA